jgi:hypothetical protein
MLALAIELRGCKSLSVADDENGQSQSFGDTVADYFIKSASRPSAAPGHGHLGRTVIARNRDRTDRAPATVLSIVAPAFFVVPRLLQNLKDLQHFD